MLQRLSTQEASPSESPVYADGIQVNHVTGDVIRWRKDTETAERFDAQSYIKDCEREIASLRDQVGSGFLYLLSDATCLPLASCETALYHVRTSHLARGLNKVQVE